MKVSEMESRTGLPTGLAQGRRALWQQEDAQTLGVVKLLSVLLEQQLVIHGWVRGCEVKKK